MYGTILIAGFGEGVIGVLTAATIEGLGINFLGLSSLTPALALVIGYAGGDFIENVYKIIIKKPSLYSFPKEKEK